MAKYYVVGGIVYAVTRQEALAAKAAEADKKTKR